MSSSDQSRKQFVCLVADGVYCQARLEEVRQCLLVLIGADEEGNKELVGLTDGYRESEQSLARTASGPKTARLAGGPGTRPRQRGLDLWKDVLDKLPKGAQARAKRGLQQIWMPETQAGAGRAFDHIVAIYEAKDEQEAECLVDDREDLLAFYDYPAEHWRQLRTTNPEESVFATVRLRTLKTRERLSRKTACAMVLELVLSARQKWRHLNGPKRLAQVIEGVQFRNGIQEVRRAA